MKSKKTELITACLPSKDSVTPERKNGRKSDPTYIPQDDTAFRTTITFQRAGDKPYHSSDIV
jgi:hypothetical protein